MKNLITREIWLHTVLVMYSRFCTNNFNYTRCARIRFHRVRTRMQVWLYVRLAHRAAYYGELTM